MKSRLALVLTLLLVVTALPLLAKDKDKAKKEKDVAPAATTAPADGVAAYLGSESITMDEVNKQAEAGMERMRQQEAQYRRQVAQQTYEIRRAALDQIVQDKLLAKEAAARSTTADELVKTEIEGKAGEPTKDEIKDFYEKNKARMGGKNLDQASPDIEKGLRQMKVQTRRAAFVKELQDKANLRVMLDPPRIDVKVPAGWPGTKGPEKAPVTLVEFSDFQCPYCKRAEPTVEQILADYGDKIRFAYRDYPLSFHPRAMPSSIAAHCAADQGKYWEMFTNLMHEQGDLSDDDLKKRAATVGLDSAKFQACYESKKPEATIKASFDDGAAAGVTGTPSFFVNGRMIVGAKPIEEFKALIDEEIARATTK
ncbi:MAG: thioredoxin domain-containing protein [Acidobacteriia bacterium]|nr:thioredoxin domain-containing protein [Terriglobia bacterium]